MFTEKNDWISLIDYLKFESKEWLHVFLKNIVTKLSIDKNLCIWFKTVLKKIFNHEPISEIDEISIRALIEFTEFQKKYNRTILNWHWEDTKIPEWKDFDSIYLILEKLIVLSRVKWIILTKGEKFSDRRIENMSDWTNDWSVITQNLLKQLKNIVNKILLDSKHYYEFDWFYYVEVGEILKSKKIIILKNIETGEIASYNPSNWKIIWENNQIHEIQINNWILVQNWNYLIVAKKEWKIILYNVWTWNIKCWDLKLDWIDLKNTTTDSKWNIYLLAFKWDKKVVLRISANSQENNSIWATKNPNFGDLINSKPLPQKNWTQISITQMWVYWSKSFQFVDIDINKMYEDINWEIYMVVIEYLKMWIWNINSWELFWGNKKLEKNEWSSESLEDGWNASSFDKNKWDIIYLNEIISNNEDGLIVCMKKWDKFYLWNINTQELLINIPPLASVYFQNITQDTFWNTFLPAELPIKNEEKIELSNNIWNDNIKWKYVLINVNFGIILWEDQDIDYIWWIELVQWKNDDFYKVVEKDNLKYLMNTSNWLLEELWVEITEFFVDKIVEDNKNNKFINAKTSDWNFVLINIITMQVIGLKNRIKELLINEHVVDINWNMFFEIKNIDFKTALLDTFKNKVRNYNWLKIYAEANRVTCDKWFFWNNRKIVKWFKPTYPI